MIQAHRYRPGDHRSRREIDLAIGVLIGMRRCSAHQALETLVEATRVTGVGLGAVSGTLLTVVTGDAERWTVDKTSDHWRALLELPTGACRPATPHE